jgi:hypothetical protein
MMLVPLGVGVKGVQAGKIMMKTGSAIIKDGVETSSRAAKILAKQAQRGVNASKNAVKVAGKASVAGTMAVTLGAGMTTAGAATIVEGTAVRYMGEMGGGGEKKTVTEGAKKIALETKIASAEAHSGVSSETVMKNANLPDAERFTIASSLLGRQMDDVERDAILTIHNDISKGVYQNGHKELRAMTEELDKAGFSREEGRKLMENGVLGNPLKDFFRSAEEIAEEKASLARLAENIRREKEKEEREIRNSLDKNVIDTVVRMAKGQLSFIRNS